MCGIAGVFGAIGYGEQHVTDMLDVLAHRGPDDQGLISLPGCILGQRRLSIIDLEGGHQPIVNETGDVWLVCNGEIYNYQELRENLVAAGHRFRTQSDSEVILHLYEEHGRDCVSHLRGMFAFVIWDAKKRTVLAARDHLGQKPLYFARVGGGVAFASEIKALLKLEPSLRSVSKAALDQYLTLRIVASPLSMFDGVEKLPPAHTLEFELGEEPNIQCYWRLSYEPKLDIPDAEIVDALEERLVESIRLHMVSDVPVGVLLSGGLDSSLIVALLMTHVAREPVSSFTIGLPYRQFDESPAARIVAERFGTDHHEKTLTPSISDLLGDLVWHLDEPSDPLSICSYLIAEMVSEHVKVVLGGDGGDELFGGYDRYYGNLYASYYSLIPAALRKRLIGPLLNRMPDGAWYKSFSHQMQWLHELSFASGADRYARSLSYFYFGAAERAGLYGPGMLELMTSYSPEEAVRRPYLDALAHNPVDRMLNSDSCVRLPDHPVMILDRMTMAHSVEARAPFMDHEVAEFCARLPVRWKVRGRRLRVIQRELARRYIPDSVLNRPKQGFSSALPYLLKDEYQKLYGQVLRDSQLAADGYLDQRAIDRLVSEHNAGQADHGNRLWLVLNSEVWYRMHIKEASLPERVEHGAPGALSVSA